METAKWLKANFKELKKRYAGRYLAIYRDKVVASGSTAGEVLQKTKELKIEQPSFIHIPATKTVFY